MKLKNSTYFGFLDGRVVSYPRLEITVSETDTIRKGNILVELHDNKYLSKEDAIKYFKWAIEQIESIPDN